MGASKTKHAVSEEFDSEKKHRWNKGKTHKKKKKNFVVHNGISEEYKEITKETECDNYTKFKRIVETKIVHHKRGEPVQKWDSNMSSKLCVEPETLCIPESLDNYQQKDRAVYNSSFDSGYISSSLQTHCQPESNENKFSSYNCDSEQGFENEIMDNRDNTNLRPIREKNEWKPSLECVAEIEPETSHDSHKLAPITKQSKTFIPESLDNYQQKSRSVYNSCFDSGYKSKCLETYSQFESNENKFNVYNCQSKQGVENKTIDNRDTGNNNLSPIREKTEWKPKHRQICDTCFKSLHPVDSGDSSKDETGTLNYDAASSMNDKRKTSLNSLLDERKSSISSEPSHTEMKTRVTETIPNLKMNYELPSMEQLKPNLHNETDGIHNTDLKTMNGEDNTDEGSSSNVTYVKELSSSYPDSNLCSDSEPLLTQSSEECFSVSSYSTQRSSADSTTVAKEVAKYNNLSKINIEKADFDPVVMNTYNISVTDDMNTIPNTESQPSENIPEMNDVDTTVDLSDASQSQVSFNEDEEAIKTHTQCDLTNKNLKGAEDDALSAVILSIHILTKGDMDFVQKNQKIVKNIIDFEVDYENISRPSTNKCVTDMGHTKYDESLPNLEYANIDKEKYQYMYGLINCPVHDSLSIVIFMLLLFWKRKNQIIPDLDTKQVYAEKKVENKADVFLLYQRIKRSDGPVVYPIPMENSHDFGESTSEIMIDDRTDIDETVDADALQTPGTDNAESCKSELSQSNIPDNPELNCKHTETKTETYQSESATVELENDETVQNNFVANKEDGNNFEQNEHDESKLKLSESACNAKSEKSELTQGSACNNSYLQLKETDISTKTYHSENVTIELENEEAVRNIYIASIQDSDTVEHKKSKLKLSESVIISSLEEETDVFVPSNDNNTSSMGKDERSMKEYCDKTSVKENESHDKDRYEIESVNENFESEAANVSSEMSAAHVQPAIVVEVEKAEDAEETDITRMDVKDDKSTNLVMENISGRTECSPSETDISRENIKIGSTKRDREGKQLNFERKLESVLTTDLQSMPSEESVTGPKKKKRSIKERNSSTTANGNAYEMYTFQHKSVIAMNFCQHCHQKKSRQNQNCSECRILNGELGSGKFQYQVMSKDDSGISSLLSSIRSSILSEMESLQSIEITKLSGNRKRNRKKITEKYFKLGTLNRELQNITKRFNDDYLRNADRNIVAFPGLQSYFDSLNNGQTPSLQEQMRYEWLRLMSFSNYTGGGSPVHLARNGFYHSGNGETRCFHCNTFHFSWTYSENVQETHRRISPNCPLVTGGIEINENVSIQSGSTANLPLQPPANLGNGSGGSGTGQGGSQSGVYSASRPDLPTSHGGFASNAPQAPTFSFPPASTALGISASPFSFNPPQPAVPRPDPSEFRFPQTSSHVPPDVPSHVGQSAATVTSNAATMFSFGSSVNAPPPPAEFTFAQGTGQQGGGTDITSQLGALTLQQSIAQQPSDEPISGNPVIAPTQPLQIARHTGEDQLSISAQQPPETHDLPQNPARNQRTPGNESSGSAPPAQQTENADNIEITQLKHPRYRTMDVRMSSFRSWPNYLNQTPRQMAYAGFFHPGVADFARCFCCGGGLRNWEADDDPMVEHARWYPRCEYINRLKGSHFVQAVLRRHREHMAERQREQEVPQNTFLTPDPMSTSVAANLLEMGFTQERAREAILTVRRLRGRAEVSIEEVTAWMLDDGTTQNQGPPDRGTTVNPRDTVGNAPPQPGRPQTPASSGSGSFESAVTSRHDSDGHSSVEDGGQRQDRRRGSTEGATGGSKKGDKPPKSKSSKEDSSSDEKPKSGKQDSSDDDDEKSKDKDKSSKEDQSSDDKSKSDKGSDQKKGKSKKDKKAKSRKGSMSPAPGSAEGATGASADVDTKSLKEENKLLKQMQVCKICMDKYVSITFLPCGHLVCCEDCAKSMRKCPICRKRIKGQVRTFMS